MGVALAPSALRVSVTKVLATIPSPASTKSTGNTGYKGVGAGRGASGKVRRNTRSATPASAKKIQSPNTA